MNLYAKLQARAAQQKPICVALIEQESLAPCF